MINTDFLITVIIISLIIQGIYTASREGMILSEPRIMFLNLLDKYFKPKTAEFIAKPIISCQYCMSSVWTLILFPFLDIPFWHVLFLVPAVCGCNTLFSAITKNLDFD